MLKPRIIAALIIIVAVIVGVLVTVVAMEYALYILFPPVDYTNMSLAQQQVVISQGCGCGISPMMIIMPILIIGGLIGLVGLSIEYLKALAEALKPCIIKEE